MAKQTEQVDVGLEGIGGEVSDVHRVLGGAEDGSRANRHGDFGGSYVDTGGCETVAWFGMGTVRSSRKRKSAAAVARKRPAASTVKRKPSPAGKAARATSRGAGGAEREGREEPGPGKKDRAAAMRGSADARMRAAARRERDRRSQANRRAERLGSRRSSDRSRVTSVRGNRRQAAQAQADRSPPALPIPIASFTF